MAAHDLTTGIIRQCDICGMWWHYHLPGFCKTQSQFSIQTLPGIVTRQRREALRWVLTPQSRSASRRQSGSRAGQGGDTGLAQLLLTRGDGYKIILNMSPLSSSMSAIIDLKPDSYSLCKGHPPSPRPWVITNILDHNTFDPELTTTSSGNIFTIWERGILREYLENIENWFLCHACLRTDSISSYSSSDEKRRAFVKWR